jgi:L-alanine-DL-glutamate epimerase-like enolase superfamily enzyme
MQRGVMQLASNAILNAIWDLWAKVEGKPLWKLVADFTPEQLVSVIDFRYITDELTPEQALAMLKEKEKTKQERMDLALKNKVGVFRSLLQLESPNADTWSRRSLVTTPVSVGLVFRTPRSRPD